MRKPKQVVFVVCCALMKTGIGVLQRVDRLPDRRRARAAQDAGSRDDRSGSRS